jgi:hypothetical protein
MGVFHGTLRWRQDLTSILIFSMLSNIVAAGRLVSHTFRRRSRRIERAMSGRAAAKKIARAAAAVEGRE